MPGEPRPRRDLPSCIDPHARRPERRHDHRPHGFKGRPDALAHRIRRARRSYARPRNGGRLGAGSAASMTSRLRISAGSRSCRLYRRRYSGYRLDAERVTMLASRTALPAAAFMVLHPGPIRRAIPPARHSGARGMPTYLSGTSVRCSMAETIPCPHPAATTGSAARRTLDVKGGRP